jgi:hypothetical protein
MVAVVRNMGVRRGKPHQRSHRRADLADDLSYDVEGRFWLFAEGRHVPKGCSSRCSSTGWSSRFSMALFAWLFFK